MSSVRLNHGVQVVLMAPTVGGGWADDEGSVKSKAVEEGEKIGHGIQQTLGSVLLRSFWVLWPMFLWP